MAPESTYTFGPFVFDPQRRQLVAHGEPFAIPDRHLDILHLLVSRAGQIVAKNTLIDAAWKDVAVGDNSLEQAISQLRKRLGRAPDGSQYIETLARRGYRFRGPVTSASTATRETDAGLSLLLAPYRGFVEGRTAVETLGREAVSRARETFESVVAAAPDYAPAHIGLANALALGFEAIRASDTPDVVGLHTAVEHAREACRLSPDSGEAWATLAFVLSRTGGVDGVAAGRRAMALEPDNWRHHLRLAYATWGEERLRAAHGAAKLLAGLGLAHWLAATVHVARQAFDEAVHELTRGTEAQDGQHEGGRFNCVGLHLLLGLVLAAQGDANRAEHHFRRELAFEPLGHIYTSQACATAWSAIGAIRLGAARTSEAVDAFTRALERVPGQLSALAAMSVIADAPDRAAAAERLQQRMAALHACGAVIEAAIAGGTADVLDGHHAAAAERVRAALQASASPTSAGWTIPIDPLLQVQATPDIWRAVLATVRSRAA